MAYAVELFFDAATEAAIRRFTVYGNDTSRPHVSLGGCRDLRDGEIVVRALETLAAEQSGPLPVTLDHLGLFPGNEGAIFYGVTVTTALLLLHRRFHALFTPQVFNWSPFYEPGRWVPHCTLAHGVPHDRIPETVASLQKQIPPSLSGLLISIALVEIPSAAERAVFTFDASGVPE